MASNGAPRVVCKGCDTDLVHPALKAGTTALWEHISTAKCIQTRKERGLGEDEWVAVLDKVRPPTTLPTTLLIYLLASS